MEITTIRVPSQVVPDRDVYNLSGPSWSWIQTYTWLHRAHADGRADYREKTDGKSLRDAFQRALNLALKWDWQYGFQFYDVDCIHDKWHEKHARTQWRITPTFFVGTRSIQIRDILQMNATEISDLAQSSDRPYLFLDQVSQIRNQSWNQNDGYKRIMLLCSDNVWRLMVLDANQRSTSINNQYPIIVPKEWKIKVEYV